jgi:hypothetical protein
MAQFHFPRDQQLFDEAIGGGSARSEAPHDGLMVQKRGDPKLFIQLQLSDDLIAHGDCEPVNNFSA